MPRSLPIINAAHIIDQRADAQLASAAYEVGHYEAGVFTPLAGATMAALAAAQPPATPPLPPDAPPRPLRPSPRGTAATVKVLLASVGGTFTVAEAATAVGVALVAAICAAEQLDLSQGDVVLDPAGRVVAGTPATP